MMTTFDDYIKCKGIQPNRIYSISETANILNIHKKTVGFYLYDGKKTQRNGIVSLPYHITVKGCEIIGADLIDFLRKTHRVGGD
ncbi:MAG: hypothetical protein WC455_27680 [Dehalococcoidia bacterium]|jgi:hypothetical protein